MGNIHSIKKQINHLGYEVNIFNSPQEIEQAEKIILPGVGHFAKAMDFLKEKNFLNALNNFALNQKKPILGICLGMQLMTKFSEEGNCNGLGWIDAKVKKFNFKDKLNYKVPHIGWNNVNFTTPSPLMKNINQNDPFYFVHSFFVENSCENSINSTNYGINFCSAFQKENIFGVQYHPEKSHDVGIQLLKNFLAL